MKENFYYFLDALINGLKYQGLKGFYFIYHALKVKFFRVNSNRNYEFLSFKFFFSNQSSLVHLFYDNFCINTYFFKSNKQKPIIVDIGANIGDSVIYFKHLYPNSIIYAFEPHPKAYKILSNNVKANGLKNVHLYKEALSDKNRKTLLYGDNSDTFQLTTISKDFINKTLEQSNSSAKLNSFETNFSRLSEKKFIKSIHEIDLIKIDIEGGESILFNDLKNILYKTKQLIFEFHLLPKIKNNSFDNIVSSLAANNFSINISSTYRNLRNLTNEYTFFVVALKK